MSIHGIGVDLVKNSRIQKILVKSYAKNFITKVLHKEEIKQFDKLLKSEAQVQYVASRWAVKQAVVKAVGRRQLIFSQLQTVKDGYGKPHLNICSQQNKKLLQQMHVQKIHISLAHEDDFTTAYAIAISK